MGKKNRNRRRNNQQVVSTQESRESIPEVQPAPQTEESKVPENPVEAVVKEEAPKE
jgi:hypothetical protein